MPTTSISTLQGDVTSGVTVTSDAGITEYLEAALEKLQLMLMYQWINHLHQEQIFTISIELLPKTVF